MHQRRLSLNQPARHSGPRSGPPITPKELAARDGAFAAWLATSLLSMLLGCTVAKLAQATSHDPGHPAAALGACVIVASVLLALVAGARFLARGPASRMTRSDRALFALATLVAVAIAWASLAMIVFADWRLGQG